MGSIFPIKKNQWNGHGKLVMWIIKIIKIKCNFILLGYLTNTDASILVYKFIPDVSQTSILETLCWLSLDWKWKTLLLKILLFTINDKSLISNGQFVQKNILMYPVSCKMGEQILFSCAVRKNALNSLLKNN